MDKILCINRLYAWVLHNNMNKDNVSVEEIIKGIEHMKNAYNHKNSNLAADFIEAADFTSPAYRCAYLHKYAPIHTVLVSDIVERVIELHYNYFYDLIISSGCVNVCSLGGGPGSDIVGIVLSLHNAFGSFEVFTNVIDCMPHWNDTLNSLILETQRGDYGKLRSIFSEQYFDWKYIGANLLEKFCNKVSEAISSADIINMIKFVSAAVCVDTPTMIKRIFNLMKPGAVVFFVDNSVGNVKRILTKTAEECELEPLYGPISHEHYINKLVETTRFGYSSCFQTKIAIQVWVKPHRPVQTWHGSPVQAWTPFGAKKNKRIQELEHAQNQETTLPFCNVSKSLLFDETEYDEDDGPAFCSDEVEYETDSTKAINSDPNYSISTPGFSNNFQKQPLLSTPNSYDSFLSSPSNLTPSPLMYNINYSSPMRVRNYKNSNFHVRHNFSTPMSTINLNEKRAMIGQSFNSLDGHNILPKDSWRDESYTSSLDSGCWSASSSFNTVDNYNCPTDVDYRTMEHELNHGYSNNNSLNSSNGLNYFNGMNASNGYKKRYEEIRWYENRENIPSNDMNFYDQSLREGQRPNWKYNSLNNFSKAPRSLTVHNDTRFNPYRCRVGRI